MEILSGRILHLSLFILLLAYQVQGQITPPVIECLKGDTVQWSLPGNPCGNFVSVEIFFSSSAGGPFVSLATITDEMTSRFVHEVSGLRFYYMQSTYNCNPSVSAPSDTITSMQREEVQIERVSVREDGAVSVRWYPHPSSRIVAYVIEKTFVELGRVENIDTVFGQLEYNDFEAEADLHPEFYRVYGYDACGNETAKSFEAHTTIHLTDSLDYCQNLLALKWTNYTGWDSGVERNEYWLGIDGPQAYEHEEDGNSTLGGIILNFENGVEYCVSIYSKQNGQDVFARSNTICFIADNPIPLSQLQIDNVTVVGDDIEVQWTISSDADLDSLDLLRSADGVDFQTISHNDFPTSDMNLYEDQQVNPQDQSFQYEFTAVDACGNLGRSGLAQSIHLNVETDDQNNNLISWTPFDIAGRDLQSYVLCKTSGSTVDELAMPGVNENSFMESIDPLSGSLDVCYQLKAVHLDDQGMNELEARSNMACIEQQVQVYLPNAFVPGGANPIFRPEFVFEDAILNYRFMVYDRWGVLLFESTDVGQGWDGTVNGQMMSPGVFTFFVEVEQFGSSRKVFQGDVTLLR